MRRAFLFFLLAGLFCVTAHGASGSPACRPASFPAPQDTSSTDLLRRVDRDLYRMQHSDERDGRIDTAYIGIPQERWMLQTQSIFDFSTLSLIHGTEEEGFRSHVHTRPTLSQGFTVSWRNLAIDFSVKPALLVKVLNSADNYFNLGLTGRKWGVSVGYRMLTTHHGSTTWYPTGEETPDNTGETIDFTASIDGYYIIRGRRYAHPAALTQSLIQKRSAGSPLLCASAHFGIVDLLDPDYAGDWPDKGSILTRMQFIHFQFGGGYGYNWVPAENWLFHTSAQACLSVYGNNAVETVGGDFLRYQRPGVTGRIRLVALHGGGRRFFYGIQATTVASAFGSNDHFRVQRSSTQAFLFVGWRL